MSTPNLLSATPDELQRARAAHLKELLEPWSLRKLATRTGLSKSVVDARLSGTTPLTMPDIEVFAPVLRMTPVELFSVLEAIKPDGPHAVGGGAQIVGITRARGWKLPHLDSNQEPIGYPLRPPSEILDLGERRRAKQSTRLAAS